MHKILMAIRVLGTPNEESWPGVKQLADYKPTFPQWSAQDLAEQVPYLDEAGIDLLKVNFVFFPILKKTWVKNLPPNSKLSHTTAPGAFLQNVRLCTHISLIIEDRTPELPLNSRFLYPLLPLPPLFFLDFPF